MNQTQVSSPDKVRVGHTTFWNLNGKSVAMPPVERQPPRVREIGPATLTPRRYPPKIDGPRKGAIRYLEGGIYDGNDRILPEWRERQFHDRDSAAGNRLHNKFILNRELRPVEQRLDGAYAYMGLMRGHFGHFLLETLCRLWFLLRADPDVRFLFHGTSSIEELPSFVRYVFDLLEIDPGRVVVVDKVCAVEHLIVPDSAFEIRWKARTAHAESFAELFDRNRVRSGISSSVKRVYLTRRQLDVSSSTAARKQVFNEKKIEDVFAGRSFEIVAPEKIPFADQIALAGGANQIAGLKGSALHMSLFSQQPRAKLIQLDKSPSINQCLIDGLKGMEAHHIICKKAQEDGGFRVDVDLLRQILREI